MRWLVLAMLAGCARAVSIQPTFVYQQNCPACVKHVTFEDTLSCASVLLIYDVKGQLMNVLPATCETPIGIAESTASSILAGGLLTGLSVGK